MKKSHPAYKYVKAVVSGAVEAPRYVVAQCAEFKAIADGAHPLAVVNDELLNKVDQLLGLMIMPKGTAAGRTLADCAVGYQRLMWSATLCVVYRDDPAHRLYETALFEIARKNFKTYSIAVEFLLILLMEPSYAKLFSVAPDGSLSREIKSAMEEIIVCSPALYPPDIPEEIFKIRRDDILCKLNHNDYVPLNYSNSRLDGRLPSAFLIDETGALPNSYAIEAMRSGQVNVVNKLGCIISTKYPNEKNPFEAEVAYAKKVLDGVTEDPTLFALLYEPDEPKGWETDDRVLKHANPAALEVPQIWDNLIAKRKRAIEQESTRENFLTKHCNIIYRGLNAETYIPMESVLACVKPIDWTGRDVWLGVDLAMTNDNCAVSMVGLDSETILLQSWAFIPEDRMPAKVKAEKCDYPEHIRQGTCFACGGAVVDYAFIEDFVFGIEERYGVHVLGIGYDRYNAISSAQKWEHGRGDQAGYQTVAVLQHSSVLHAPTKLLLEHALSGTLRINPNALMMENFENCRCTYDTNLNRYLNKKKSTGKIDMVFAALDALYLLQQELNNESEPDWLIQV